MGRRSDVREQNKAGKTVDRGKVVDETRHEVMAGVG